MKNEATTRREPETHTTACWKRGESDGCAKCGALAERHQDEQRELRFAATAWDRYLLEAEG